MSDLPLRGDPGIGPARAYQALGIGAEGAQGLEEAILDRISCGLALPTTVGPPVIGDEKAKALEAGIGFRHSLGDHASRFGSIKVRRCEKLDSVFYSLTVEKPLYFDWKSHLAEWHRFILPVFVLVAAVALVLFLVLKKSVDSPWKDWDPAAQARFGLIPSSPEAVFDPAFVVASPRELVLAPKAVSFDQPVGSAHGALTYNAQPFLTNRHLGDDINGIGGWNSDMGDPVYAVADGQVVYAGWPSDGWGNVVILLHELPDGEIVQTFYGHLDTMTVPVGRQVRRGEKVGTIGNADGVYLAHLHFEIRRSATFDVGVGYSDEKLGRLPGELVLGKWRTREDDELAPAVAGMPLEPGALKLDVDESGEEPSVDLPAQPSSADPVDEGEGA